MLEPINAWMDSKYAFGPVSFCNYAAVAIVPNEALTLQCISHIRLDLWLSLITPLLWRNIALTVWVMLLTCDKCWQ